MAAIAPRSSRPAVAPANQPAAPSEAATAKTAPAAPLPPTWWDENWKTLTLILSLFFFLVGVAVIGARFVSDMRAQRDVETRMGAKMNLVNLPDMSVRVGNGLQLDLKVKVELQAGIDTTTVKPNADRILDRLVDRMSDVPADKLDGSEGAKFVKEAIDAAVRTEFDAGKVKGILVDKMVVH